MAGEEKEMTPEQRKLARLMSQPPSSLRLPEERITVVRPPLLGEQPFPTPKAPSPPRDIAIELFKFYLQNQTGPEVPLKLKPLPAEPKKENTKLVRAKDKGLTEAQKVLRAQMKERQEKIPDSKEYFSRQEMLSRWKALAKSPNFPKSGEYKPVAIEIAMERARREAAANIIRDAIHFAFGVPGGSTPELSNSMMSREEQNYMERIKRRAFDAQAEREAIIAKQLMEEGKTRSTLSEIKAMKEADKRTLEGRQVAERNRLTRQQTEKSLLGSEIAKTTPAGTMPVTQTPLKGGALGGGAVIGFGGGGLIDQIK